MLCMWTANARFIILAASASIAIALDLKILELSHQHILEGRELREDHARFIHSMPKNDRMKHGNVTATLHYAQVFSCSVLDAVDAMNAHDTHVKHSALDTGGLVYCAALLSMLVVVVFMFRHVGPYVCFQISVYVSCLALIKIVIKQLYLYGFDYPKFVTSCHLFLSTFAAFVVLFHRMITLGKPVPVPTSAEFFMGILPISAAFGISIANDNTALVYVSVAFAEVVASCNPVMSVLLTWAMGLPFNFSVLMPVGVVVLGCAITVTGEMSFSAFGLALLLVGIFLRGLKAVLQQKMMTGETKDKFDPVTLMAWTTLCSFMIVLAYSIMTEGMGPVKAIGGTSNLPGLLATLLGSCVIACILNMSALFVVKNLGAVGMQMVSQMKSIMVVIGSLFLLSENFSRMQWLGFAAVMFGVFWYSRLQRGEKQSENASSGLKGK